MLDLRFGAPFAEITHGNSTSLGLGVRPGTEVGAVVVASGGTGVGVVAPGGTGCPLHMYPNAFCWHVGAWGSLPYGRYAPASLGAR